MGGKIEWQQWGKTVYQLSLSFYVSFLSLICLSEIELTNSWNLKQPKYQSIFLILVWKCNGLKEISYATPINKIYNIIIRKSNLIKK